MSKKSDEIKVPGFFVNLDWSDTIQNLSDADAGTLFKNMFNYSLEQPLLETTEVVKAICDIAVFKTIDINKVKYYEKIERNKLNGKKGGRPQGAKNETKEKPKGFLENPDKPKNNINEISKEKIELDISVAKEKMQQIFDLDLQGMKGNDEKDFCLMVKELVKYLGRNRFEMLIFFTKDRDVPGLLNEYGHPELLEGIFAIKENYPYLINSILK